MGSAVVFYNDAVAGAAVAVKTAAGRLNGIAVCNTTAAVAYLQVFNKAAADVVLGTTVPVASFRIPASSSRDIAIPLDIDGAGISVAGTTLAGNATGATLSVVASVA